MIQPRSPSRHRFIAVAVLTTLILGITAAAGTRALFARDRHFLWNVDTAQGRVTIMGSIHTLRDDAYPLPAVYERAYSDAEGLVFETDMARMEEPAVQARLLALGLNPEGGTLRDRLSPDAYETLAEALGERGLPPEQFAPFKPWFCAFTLTLLELQRLGYQPRNGLDRHFFNKAARDGKTLYHLESVEAQIRLLASLEQGGQEAFLLQSLQELDLLGSKAAEMTEAWRTGDTGGLDAFIRMSFEGFPDLYDRFIVQRNRNWLPLIEDLIRDGENVLVIVGAGHLVGDEGLVQLLEDRGHRLEQQ
ncbi:MAG: TraB/GumN family protein [Deltaproteobacteria bacterium]|nr:TraB/GumN family protein [Deltaproteobacteria bacterium]